MLCWHGKLPKLTLLYTPHPFYNTLCSMSRPSASISSPSHLPTTTSLPKQPPSPTLPHLPFPSPPTFPTYLTLPSLPLFCAPFSKLLTPTLLCMGWTLGGGMNVCGTWWRGRTRHRRLVTLPTYATHATYFLYHHHLPAMLPTHTPPPPPPCLPFRGWHFGPTLRVALRVAAPGTPWFWDGGFFIKRTRLPPAACLALCVLHIHTRAGPNITRFTPAAAAAAPRHLLPARAHAFIALLRGFARAFLRANYLPCTHTCRLTSCALLPVCLTPPLAVHSATHYTTTSTPPTLPLPLLPLLCMPSCMHLCHLPLPPPPPPCHGNHAHYPSLPLHLSAFAATFFLPLCAFLVLALLLVPCLWD